MPLLRFGRLLRRSLYLQGKALAENVRELNFFFDINLVNENNKVLLVKENGNNRKIPLIDILELFAKGEVETAMETLLSEEDYTSFLNDYDVPKIKETFINDYRVLDVLPKRIFPGYPAPQNLIDFESTLDNHLGFQHAVYDFINSMNRNPKHELHSLFYRSPIQVYVSVGDFYGALLKLGESINGCYLVKTPPDGEIELCKLNYRSCGNRVRYSSYLCKEDDSDKNICKQNPPDDDDICCVQCDDEGLGEHESRECIDISVFDVLYDLGFDIPPETDEEDSNNNKKKI